ncbi:MAG: Holliday junction resolvase RuvX [Candidatus Binataceae bacterium]
MSTLALDLGKRRIGVAVTDMSDLAAHPLATIERGKSKSDLDAILALIEGRHVERVIVGLPLNMDGTEGQPARAARAFAEALSISLGLPVELHDERLSSFEARERLKQGQLRRSKRKRTVDQIAAVVILESWLARARQI